MKSVELDAVIAATAADAPGYVHVSDPRITELADAGQAVLDTERDKEPWLRLLAALTAVREMQEGQSNG